ncbi:hypothetical protein SCAR479_02843 [Seiridium cardinale]|uniref:Uncharacterized protein n=1 Tax=Seiridium cardinale TaxID=138064 RepID=A0ABR2Y2T7_9PEZI
MDSSGAPPKDGLQPAETEQRYEFCVLLDVSAWTGKPNKRPLTCPKCEAQLDLHGHAVAASTRPPQLQSQHAPRKGNISSSKMNVGAQKDDGDGDDGGVDDLDRPNDDIDTD